MGTRCLVSAIGVLEQRFPFERNLHNFRRLRSVHCQDVEGNAAVDHVKRLSAAVIGNGLHDIDGIIAVPDGNSVSYFAICFLPVEELE
jgi:hypothetical protein